MAATVIEEFLVALGYRIDPAAERRFIDSVENATKRVVALGAGLEAAAFAITAAAVRIADNFERIYYASQRTGSSAKELNAFGYAASQLGSSSGAAASSVENFAKMLRTLPGLSNQLQSLGIATEAAGKARGAVEIMVDLAAKLHDMPYANAYYWSQHFGLDEETFRAMRLYGDKFASYMQEYRDKIKKIGFDPDKAAEDAKKFDQAWRSMGVSIDIIGSKIISSLFNQLGGNFKDFNDFLDKNGDKIADVITKIASAILKLAEAIIKFLLDPRVQAGIDWIGEHWQLVFGAILAYMTTKWLVGIVAIFAAAGRAAVAMLAGPLGRLLVALGVIPAALAGIGLAVTSTSLNAGETPGEGGPASPYGGGGGRSAREDQEAGRIPGGGANPSSFDNRSWWQRNAPAWAGGRPAPSAPSASDGSGGRFSRYGHTPASFSQKAPGVMDQLMQDFPGLTKQDAAIIMGNLGHESRGFQAFNEDNGGPGRGWAQWTDPGRKRRFFAYAQDRGLDPKSDEANYGFLKWELQHTHKSSMDALMAAQTPGDKMRAFEHGFEGAGIKNYGSRWRYARDAMRAYDARPASTGAGNASAPAAPSTGGGFGNVDRPLPFDFGPTGGPGGNFMRERLGTFAPGGSGFVPPPGAESGSDKVSEADRSITMSPTTHITVTGVSEPGEAARMVGARVDRSSSDLMRNLQGAVA